MTTMKLKIENLSDSDFAYIYDLQLRYSAAFRSLYKVTQRGSIKAKTAEWKLMVKTLGETQGLTAKQMETMVIDVDTKIKQIQTFNEKQQALLVSIENDIAQLKLQEKSKKNAQILFKLNQKISAIHRNAQKDIVFGQKTILQRIGFLSNMPIDKRGNLQELRQLYTKNRMLPFSLIGVADCGTIIGTGNINLVISGSFSDGTGEFLFKPNKKTKIKFRVIAHGKQLKMLDRVQWAANNKLIPLSFKLSTEYIWLSYDEARLNNYHFDETMFKRELIQNSKDNPNLTKEERSAYATRLVKKYHDERRFRQLEGKQANRFMSVDLNPAYVGYAICDYVNNKQKVIAAGCYDLSELSVKLKLKSSDEKQVAQNNKRKHEISQVWTRLFELATHFKVGYFIAEQLNFDNAYNKPPHPTEASRKIRNTWHRTLTQNLITKHTNSLGLILAEINPAYTSAIGNLTHSYFDPTNASLEINRRGYITICRLARIERESLGTAEDNELMGGFYPYFSRDLVFNRVCELNPTMDDTIKSNLFALPDSNNMWVDVHKFMTENNLSYRRKLEETEYTTQCMKTPKSKVKLYIFK